ncbi:MAG: selenocysteine-specific translation elongation factor SelB [Cyanobacteria bacterium RYN_339]|nr:selenocysteine-specific translation elongation factor SelB [Cyanobacteria bacterium RYN_339]
MTDLPLVIGTAGHVDHGKTSLIRALTGVDTDRLEEEKRRGMTIDLGFAPFELPSGRLAGVVDVPGHERFLKNMLAGAGGIDLVMLVVAADDGVMPQTREHLEILSLLRVRRGLVVVTKTDLVDPELLELAVEDIQDALAGTFLDGAPLLPVAATQGLGLAELLAALDHLASDLPPRSPEGPVRLPIDRVFVKQGFGTVVTGTLLAGTLREGDVVAVEPGGLTSRVRGLQVHGGKRTTAVAGQRVAINLAGLERQALERGAWVLAPGSGAPSTLLDVQLELLPTAPALAHRARVRVHHGTAELIGRVVLLDRDVLEPGETAKAQLVLEQPAVAALGDRLVIRRYSPAQVIGGGQVLHPAPAKHKRNQAGTLAALDSLEAGDVMGALDQALAHAGRRPLSEEALLGFAPPAQREAARAWLQAHAFQAEGHQYLHKATAEGIAADALACLGSYHAKVPSRLGLDKEELAKRTKLPLGVVARVLGALVERGELRKQGRFHALPAFQPQLPEERARILAKLQEAPLADQEDFAALGAGDRLPAILEDLVEGGELVRISGGVYATGARIAAMKERLATLPTFTASQARELLETNRKYIIPFLEYLDSVGFTRRQGDVRSLMPR